MSIDIFGLSNVDEGIRKEIIRKELLNLTTSYSDEADIFTEIIQNAIDAIQLRKGIAAKEHAAVTHITSMSRTTASECLNT
jgi:DhnA family fructose-bisphosphate aldolase class Ia